MSTCSVLTLFFFNLVLRKWIMSPPLQIHMLKSQPSVPQNVTISGVKIFKKVIHLNKAIRVRPYSNMTDVIRRRNTTAHTHTETTM